MPAIKCRIFAKLGNTFFSFKRIVLQVILTSFHFSLLYVFLHVSFHYDNLL